MAACDDAARVNDQPCREPGCRTRLAPHNPVGYCVVHWPKDPARLEGAELDASPAPEPPAEPPLIRLEEPPQVEIVQGTLF